VTGELVASKGAGQKVELLAKQIEIYGTADPEKYPLQAKRHSMEFLREIAHLRPRSRTFGAVFRIRHALAFAIHKYFNDNGFFYLHTPIITGSDAEGAGEMFRVTTLDPKNPPLTETGEVDFKQDFFGKSTNLTVSGQLEGELGALALGKIYTFGPTFRAENSNTARHLAEFWMVEPEMAFYDLEDNMDLAEDFMKYLIRYALDHCPTNCNSSKRACWRRRKTRSRKNAAPCRSSKSCASWSITSLNGISYTEAVDIPDEVEARPEGAVRVPGELGHRPAIGARTVPGRKAL
jgi:asparaginyl-tRNA synthetase